MPHNKQYQRKTLLPSLLYEPLKWTQKLEPPFGARRTLSADAKALRDLSRIPVNKHINSRLRWTKYNDLYETIFLSLGLISLCLLTGAESSKVYKALNNVKRGSLSALVYAESV